MNNEQQVARPTNWRRTMHYYWLATKQYKFQLVVNLIAPIIAVVMGNTVFLYMMSIFLDRLSNYSDEVSSSDLWRAAGLVGGSLLLEFLFWRINDYTFIYRQTKAQRNLEQATFDYLKDHSYRFFSDNFSGSLITQFNRFIRSNQQLENILSFRLGTTIVMILSSTGFLVVTAPILGVPMFIWSVLFVASVMWLTLKKTPITKQEAAADSRVTASVADVLTNVLNIKIFARNKYEKERFAAVSNDRYRIRLRSWVLDAHIRNFRWFMVITFQIGYLLLAIYAVTRGLVSPIILIASQFYIGAITFRLFDLNQTIQDIERSFSEASEMTEILDQPLEVSNPKNPAPLTVSKGNIKLEDVSFRYEDSAKKVFSNLNLEIKAGQKVGLVGPSGGGKSSLTRLLLRFIDIESGSIKIDGQDISKVTQEDLRRAIAYVPQEPILFHRTLFENINYGNPDASKKEVQACAKAAFAHDFITEFPKGYDTLVGERGVKLSGGEKQRVAIARAMLSKAPILLLDEATSALDSKSEKFITQALDNLMEKRTTIVIAHRLSTIKKLDRILVMKDGIVEEDGPHDELIKKKGHYAELWSHQSGDFLED